MSDLDVTMYYHLCHRQSDGSVICHPRLYRRAIIGLVYLHGHVTLVEAREAIAFENELLALERA